MVLLTVVSSRPVTPQSYQSAISLLSGEEAPLCAYPAFAWLNLNSFSLYPLYQC